jgi:hypothetical protein
MEALWVGVIIFGLVRFFSKKITTPNFFFKKKPKPVQTGLARFFRFWLGFSVWLGFFQVWLGFFGLGSVRLGFLGFLLIKLKPNRTGRFF